MRNPFLFAERCPQLVAKLILVERSPFDSPAALASSLRG